jgi:transcriptional regulator with GAF, ATPase, and Fis domain
VNCPSTCKPRLLRAIQKKEIRPVGSTKRIPINVRILAATNRDLEQAVQQGAFRRDLYFRLNVLSLKIPPLRDRRQDIPLLWDISWNAMPARPDMIATSATMPSK